MKYLALVSLLALGGCYLASAGHWLSMGSSSGGRSSTTMVSCKVYGQMYKTVPETHCDKDSEKIPKD
jgi:hypothetical protein